MHCTSGRVILNKAGHQVAYCAQNPWLEHATIRDNIVFGSSYGFDKKRYEAVVEACALIKDLEMFDAGDMTGSKVPSFGVNYCVDVDIVQRLARRGLLSVEGKGQESRWPVRSILKQLFVVF